MQRLGMPATVRRGVLLRAETPLWVDVGAFPVQRLRQCEQLAPFVEVCLRNGGVPNDEGVLPRVGSAGRDVNGGGKVDHMGGSIVGLRLSTVSESVLTNWPA